MDYGPCVLGGWDRESEGSAVIWLRAGRFHHGSWLRTLIVARLENAPLLYHFDALSIKNAQGYGECTTPRGRSSGVRVKRTRARYGQIGENAPPPPSNLRCVISAK
jgi:hypothetical protein